MLMLDLDLGWPECPHIATAVVGLLVFLALMLLWSENVGRPSLGLWRQIVARIGGTVRPAAVLDGRLMGILML
jgi:hypothetical protein